MSNQTAVMITACAKEAATLPLCLEQLRRVFGGPVIVAMDDTKPCATPEATVPAPNHSHGGRTQGIIRAAKAILDADPGITHLAKLDADMAVLDGGIFDATPDEAVFGFRRQKWIFWGGCYVLRRDVWEWLAAEPVGRLKGWMDERHIGPAVLCRMMPAGTITISTEGFSHARDPENPIAPGSRVVHLGGFPGDLVGREMAARAFHEILDISEPIT